MPSAGDSSLIAPIDEGAVLDLLTRLVEKSLVVYEEDEQGRGRYRLLETVRQYARDRLLEAGEAVGVRSRHRDRFLALAERAEPEMFGKDQAAWLERLETEHDNLRAAWDWSMESNEANMALRLGGSIWRFWHVRGYLEEGRERLGRALTCLPSTPIPLRARALDGAAALALRLGDLPTS